MYHILGETVDDSQIIPFVNKLHFACYRFGFKNIQEYTDDCGWGCTIRSFQSMLANVFNDASTIKDDSESLFSLHNILSKGYKYGYAPGQWFSPSVTSRCIEDCLANDVNNNETNLAFHIISNTYQSKIKSTTVNSTKKLVLVNTRLGPNKIPKEMHQSITRFFSDKRCKGIVGGKTSSSYFFLGYKENSTELVYFDPHEVRSFKDSHFPKQKSLKILKLEKMDPSMTFCFQIMSTEDISKLKNDYKDIFETIQYIEPDEENDGSDETEEFILLE